MSKKKGKPAAKKAPKKAAEEGANEAPQRRGRQRFTSVAAIVDGRPHTSQATIFLFRPARHQNSDLAAAGVSRIRAIASNGPW